MLSRRLLRIKAIKSLYAHFKSESGSLIVSEKNLLYSIDKTYELYHQLLWLIVNVADYAEKRIELGQKKHLPTAEERNPNRRFVENKVIAAIRGDEDLNSFLERKKLGWVNYPELIKKLYIALTESDFYKEYMAAGSSSFKDDQKLVAKFYSFIVDTSEALEEVVEEQSIFWADDIDFANIMVLRTIDDMKASQTSLPLTPQFKNDEDKEFVKELFRRTIVNYGEFFEYIDRFTKNWDVERIAFMDNLIMATAMAELLYFDSIPVKVTLDEYIEIAKYYSTPSSNTFINGVLDKIVEDLKKENRINKSGRGLLETTL